MNKLNRCPQCRGWMIIDRNKYGWRAACLECGYSRTLNDQEIRVERKNDNVWETIQSPRTLAVV